MIFKNTVWLAKLQMTIIYPNLLQKDKKWKILLIKGRQNWWSSLKKRRPTNFFFKFCHFRNYIFFLFELLKLPTSNMNNKMILFFGTKFCIFISYSEKKRKIMSIKKLKINMIIFAISELGEGSKGFLDCSSMIDFGALDVSRL